MITHVVIFGYPRSGTTLLYCMLRSSVIGYQFYDKEIAAREAHDLNPDWKQITKAPMDIRDVDWLASNILGVRFILCIRDPRSVLVSKVREDRFKVNWDYCSHKTRHVIDKNEGFVERHKLVFNTLKHNPFICQYEDLVTNPDEVQERMRKYFGFEYREQFKDFHTKEIPFLLKIRLNGVREVSTNRVDSWKQYPERITKQFTECPELFDIVEFWDYEQNREWFHKMKVAI